MGVGDGSYATVLFKLSQNAKKPSAPYVPQIAVIHIIVKGVARITSSTCELPQKSSLFGWVIRDKDGHHSPLRHSLLFGVAFTPDDHARPNPPVPPPLAASPPPPPPPLALAVSPLPPPASAANAPPPQPRRPLQRLPHRPRLLQRMPRPHLASAVNAAPPPAPAASTPPQPASAVNAAPPPPPAASAPPPPASAALPHQDI
ncbi:hypothetical protein B0H14DRAFT_3516630 [Mycena olivaceomarginata]|nr:hypothetical protein B0H14DRAFT_3516630 [Mycena olivaceomarginata]